jgi:hypothetical protein
VGLEGLLSYPVFFLNLVGFDVPAGYIGVDGRPVGHMTVEARRQSEGPSDPCIGGVDLGTVKVGPRTTKEYLCPKDSVLVQREARHGEGAYVGHLVLEWVEGGTQYIVSAHGHTTANLVLLRRFVGSIALIDPGTTPA